MPRKAKKDGLKPDPRNARIHTPLNKALIRQSLEEVGAFRSIAVDGDDIIRAGNGVYEQAMEQGLSVRIVDAAPDELIAVRRADLKGRSAERAALWDNRTGETSEWDKLVLSEMAEQDNTILENIFSNDAEQLEKLAAAEAALQDQAQEQDKQDDINARFGTFSLKEVTDAAFEYHRRTGFPYRKLPRHVCMQKINTLAATPPEAIRMSTQAEDVADTYHPHRYHASANGMKSPYTSFMTDKSLRKAIEFELESGKLIGTEYFSFLNLVYGTQACANFRPAYALYIYKRFGPPNGIILDTSTGYGGRLIGFAASHMGQYIGIDPHSLTHAGNRKLAKDLIPGRDVQLAMVPAEDFNIDPIAGTVDLCFTSPPYFSKELYTDEPTQSHKKFPTIDGWREGFLKPLIAKQYAALKPGGINVINIADIRVGKEEYPLTAWTRQYAEEVGFQLIEIETYPLKIRLAKKEVASEPVFVFHKPGQTPKKRGKNGR